MKSRVKVIVLSLALLLCSMILADVNMVKAYADGEKTIRFHYIRPDKVYDDWTMWVWNENENGKGYEFQVAEDGSEAVSEYTCNADTQKVGFIVKGANWTKDVDEDREIDLTAITGDVIDVYLTSGVKEFETKLAENNEPTTAAPQDVASSATEAQPSGEQPAEPSTNTADEVESDDPNADYSASTGTVIVADIVVLLVVAALCFTVFGKKKDSFV
ncbi:MAG: hypothetical protein HFI34_04155 [Lachnospiraceae bacterium]|nr:hypothetical protein [Lachnospiraceae bacterium]